MKYNFTDIEKKWQDYWEKNRIFRTPEFDELDKSKPKYYVLDMFPYPSGDGLHVGHPEGYTATDIIARYKRMKGFNVMHPMGWDAFGLPTEQYAIKTGVHPGIRTAECITRFRHQLKALGFSYDWDRQITTSNEDYYKWTQWMFLKIYNSYYDDNEDKAKPIEDLVIPEGLNERERYDFVNSKRMAYLADVPVNWCPELGTVLSNEEVPEQVEKGFTVVKKYMKQWNLRITKYAQRLVNDLEKLDWPSNVKDLQINWIGRSEGATILFEMVSNDGTKHEVPIYTTRPDTIYGATYLLLAPEHKLVSEIATDEYAGLVNEYIENASRKSDLERTELAKDKTGVFTGAFAHNPFTGKDIPVLVADYVLVNYGTGAIMGVPGHDERDNEFARKYSLPIIPVVIPDGFNEEQKIDFIQRTVSGEECFTGEGLSINSELINELPTKEAATAVIKWLVENGKGKKTVNFKLRDWLFSRQRFWGEPFPIIHFDDGTFKDLPDDSLPVTLPENTSYKPSGTGKSPLSTIPEWVNTTDPVTGSAAYRETNTMPQWAGSCWYFLRFLDPGNEKEFCNKKIEEFWMPVDLYIGGVEHSVLHLIYARFWYKMLYDLGYVTHSEPFTKLFNQGMILGEDGVKMSKSRGNVINPEDVIKDFGADSMRLFEMFMGPLEATKPWSTKGIEGLNRFLNRAWRIIVDEDSGSLNKKITNEPDEQAILKLLNKTIKKVTDDIEDGDMKFNTAISYLMIFVNELYKAEHFSKEVVEKFVLILSPFAPHIAEELWSILGNESSIQNVDWPVYDPALVKEDFVTLIFQVNGKIRSKQEMEFDTDEKTLEDAALDNENVKKYILGKQIVKIITVKNKMVNIVVK